MKKYLFMAFLVAGILSGCSKSDDNTKTADWSNTKIEAKARISAQADNSKYEMRFAIRKK